MQTEPPPYSRRRPSGPPSPTSSTSPLTNSAHRSSSTASTASSTKLALPDDYNPLQYPPPSRVRVGVRPDIGDASDLDAEEDELEPESQEQEPEPTQQHDFPDTIGAFHTSTKPKVQNIQGVLP